MKNKDLKTIIKIYILIEQTEYNSVAVMPCIDYCCQINLRTNCAVGDAQPVQ